MPFQHNIPIEVRELTINDAEVCDQIILTLPHHFGDKAGRKGCAHAVRTSQGLVAVLDEMVVGFLTLQYHFETSVEITWMAIHARYRRQGIGRKLIENLRENLRARGCQILLVATLASSVDEGYVEDGYRGTRAFYQAVGFIPAHELPYYWSIGSSPALLFVMPL